MRISGSLAALVAALALAAPLSAQEPVKPAQPAQPGRMGPPTAEMMMDMKMMDSMSARLDSATARMNRTTGEARAMAMVDVLNALVAEHRMMHAHMQQMMGEHMGGMPMGHPMREQPMHGMMHPDSAHPPMRGMVRPDTTRRPR
jgi:hypothetical protein